MTAKAPHPPIEHRSPLRKAGWVWSKRGWRRVPLRPTTVKVIPVRRRRPKKLKPLGAADPVKQRSSRRGAETTAPAPMRPHHHHLAGRHAGERHKPPLRPTWGGKYAQLQDLHAD